MCSDSSGLYENPLVFASNDTSSTYGQYLSNNAVQQVNQYSAADRRSTVTSVLISDADSPVGGSTYSGYASSGYLLNNPESDGRRMSSASMLSNATLDLFAPDNAFNGEADEQSTYNMYDTASTSKSISPYPSESVAITLCPPAEASSGFANNQQPSDQASCIYENTAVNASSDTLEDVYDLCVDSTDVSAKSSTVDIGHDLDAWKSTSPEPALSPEGGKGKRPSLFKRRLSKSADEQNVTKIQSGHAATAAPSLSNFDQATQRQNEQSSENKQSAGSSSPPPALYEPTDAWTQGDSEEKARSCTNSEYLVESVSAWPVECESGVSDVSDAQLSGHRRSVCKQPQSKTVKKAMSCSHVPDDDMELYAALPEAKQSDVRSASIISSSASAMRNAAIARAKKIAGKFIPEEEEIEEDPYVMVDCKEVRPRQATICQNRSSWPNIATSMSLGATPENPPQTSQSIAEDPYALTTFHTARDDAWEEAVVKKAESRSIANIFSRKGRTARL